MSSNSSTYLKLQLGSEIRKVCTLPNDLNDIRTILKSLYGKDNFAISYLNEKEESIEIDSDTRLKEIIEKYKAKSSLKLYIREIEKEISVYDKIDMLKKSLVMSIKSKHDMDFDIIGEDSEKNSSFEAIGYEKKDSEELTVSDNQEKFIIEKNVEHLEEVKETDEKIKKKQAKEIKKPKAKKDKGEQKEKSKKKEKKIKSNSKKIKENEPVKIPRKSQLQESNAIHDEIRCDSCDVFPITGIRYKCTICHDYDLCEVCEDTINHAHPMIKIRMPIECPPDPKISPLLESTESSSLIITYLKKFIQEHLDESFMKNFKAKVTEYFNISLKIICLLYLEPLLSLLGKLLIKGKNHGLLAPLLKEKKEI